MKKIEKEFIKLGLYSPEKEEVEIRYNLLKTTRDEGTEIVQFLVAYHDIKAEEIGWDND